MSEAGEWARGEDGEPESAFGQVGGEGSEGQARGKKQAEQEYGKGRERERNGREEQGHRDVGANGGKGTAQQHDAGCAQPSKGLGKGPGLDGQWKGKFFAHAISSGDAGALFWRGLRGSGFQVMFHILNRVNDLARGGW